MTEKLYVVCYQSIRGQPTPFTAELIKDGSQQAQIKVGDTVYQVHRASCSSKPFTLDKPENSK